jgi:hypothetical protein
VPCGGRRTPRWPLPATLLSLHTARPGRGWEPIDGCGAMGSEPAPPPPPHFTWVASSHRHTPAVALFPPHTRPYKPHAMLTHTHQHALALVYHPPPPPLCVFRCAELEGNVKEAQAKADAASEQARTAAGAATQAADAARDAAQELDRQVRIRSAVERELEAERQMASALESQVRV